MDKHFHSGVIGIQQNCPLLADSFGADEAAVGHELHYEGMTFAVGDIFTAHGQLYETDLCAVVDGQPLILARPMDVSGTLSKTATLCKTGMQCMPIVGVRSRRLLLDLVWGKK